MKKTVIIIADNKFIGYKNKYDIAKSIFNVFGQGVFHKQDIETIDKIMEEIKFELKKNMMCRFVAVKSKGNSWKVRDRLERKFLKGYYETKEKAEISAYVEEEMNEQLFYQEEDLEELK